MRARRRHVRAAAGRGRSRASPGCRPAAGRREHSGQSRVPRRLRARRRRRRRSARPTGSSRRASTRAARRTCRWSRAAAWRAGCPATRRSPSGTRPRSRIRCARRWRRGSGSRRARSGSITPDVGGGFGQKIPLYREELTTAAASRLLGRPVRWIETRRENLLPSLHAREDIVDVRAAVKDGRHHPRSGRPDPDRLRRVRLLPRELHGARHRHDGARRLSTARLPLRDHGRADEQVPRRPVPRADADL